MALHLTSLIFLAVRRYQDGRLVDINRDHYEGGTIDQTTLTITNSTRDDNGNFSCELANQVNSSLSLNVVPISVYCKYYGLLFFFGNLPFSGLNFGISVWIIFLRNFLLNVSYLFKPVNLPDP